MSGIHVTEGTYMLANDLVQSNQDLAAALKQIEELEATVRLRDRAIRELSALAFLKDKQIRSLSRRVFTAKQQLIAANRRLEHALEAKTSANVAIVELQKLVQEVAIGRES